MKQFVVLVMTVVDRFTFFTVLSGSRAISGMLASTIREKRFNIKLDDLK